MSELLPDRRPATSVGTLPAIPLRNDAADYYEAPQATPGTPFKEHLAVIRRHIWLVLGVAALVVGLAAYGVLQERQLFRANAVVRLNDIRGATMGGMNADAAKSKVGGWSTDPILSQIQVLQSRAVGGAVVDKEGLRLEVLTPDFPAGLLQRGVVPPNLAGGDTLDLQFASSGFAVRGLGQNVRAAYGQVVQLAGVQFAVASQPPVSTAQVMILPREAAIDLFRSRLAATPRKSTDVIDLQYTHFDPGVAQRVVNTTAKEFQIKNALDAQRESRTRRQFAGGQLRETEAQLRDAQRRLAGFRARTQVYSSAQQMGAQQEANLTLKLRTQELAGSRRVFQSLLSRAQRPGSGGDLRALGAAPEIASNPVMQADLQKLAQYEAQLDSMRSGEWRRAATHPDVQRLNQQVATTKARIEGSARSQLQALDGQIAAVEGMRGSSSEQLRALPKAEEEEVLLLAHAQSIQKLAEQLREEYQKASIAEQVEAGQVEVVDLASAARPVGSGRFRKLLFALVVGLALGSGGAFLLESMNTSIRRRDELENVLRVPGLAVIPQIASSKGGQNSLLRLRNGRGNGNGNGKALARAGEVNEGLVAAAHAHSTGAEAYRTLRTNLIFSQAVQTLKTIVVTSASPGEGKTTTAANLAVTFAQQGMRVLLMDCDLRRARLHKMFKVAREPGLTELALEHEAAANVIHETPVENLSVLTSGTLPPNPSELLGGPRMEAVLDMLRERFDVIVLDTPPLLAASDASVLGTKTDGVLLVVRAGQTERAAGQQAVQQLSAVGARIIGAVLNDPDAKVPQYGGYYQYEYYGEES